MATEVLANEAIAPLPEVALSEPDFRAFCAALEASARGRAFLAEYARRNRLADTDIVLAALDRLATQVARQTAGTEADRIRQELRALLAALYGAQPAIDASPAAVKAAKLATLIGFVQHRIESIVAHEQSALPAEVAALILTDAAAPEAARAHLTVVPPAEQPELPIPAPAAAPPPAIALVQPAPEAIPPAQEIAPPAPDIIPRRAAIIPEINLFDDAPVKVATAVPTPPKQTSFTPSDTPLIPAHSPPRSQSGFALAEQGAGIQESNSSSEDVDSGSPLEPVLGPAESLTRERGQAVNHAPMETAHVADIGATPPPAFELTLSPPPVKRSAAPPADPLAHIMALSEEERIALFS